MAVNSYGLVTVKVLISKGNKDVVGDSTLQALCELFGNRLDVYSVDESLKDIIQEGDLVLVDMGMTSIPNTTQAFPKNKIIKIIRNNTKDRIQNVYKDWEIKILEQQRKTTTGTG